MRKSIILTRDFSSYKTQLERIPDTIRLGNQDVKATLRYHGSDAITAGWPARIGGDLSYAGSGSEITPGVTDSGLVGVGFNSGKYFQNSGGLDLDEHDVVTLIVGKYNAGSDYIFTNTRYSMLVNAGNDPQIILSDGTDSATCTDLDYSSSLGTVIMYMTFFDFGLNDANGYRGLQNGGTVFGSANPVNVDSVSIGTDFFIGALNTGGFPLNGEIYLFMMWRANGWLDNSSAAKRAEQNAISINFARQIGLLV